MNTYRFSVLDRDKDRFIVVAHGMKLWTLRKYLRRYLSSGAWSSVSILVEREGHKGGHSSKVRFQKVQRLLMARGRTK